MEKKDSKDRVNIKLTFLDLFPSFDEIDPNKEGITINFQNYSFSYDLSELIKTRDELLLPNQIPNQSIKVSLLKSDNIYASGSFTIKNGEQWVTFNYENKKKTSTNLALSLIDCIKIKFICEMDYITSSRDNDILSNTEIPSKEDNNMLIKPTPKKLYNNLTSKKKNGYLSNNAGIIGDPLDSLHTEESKITKFFENISSELKYNDENNILNNTTLSSKKKNHKNPLIKSENLSEYCPLAASSGIVGKDFKLKDNNKNKNIKRNTNNHINQKKKTNNKLNDNLNKEKDKDKHNDKKKNNNYLSNNNENLIENKNSNDSSKQKPNLKRNRSKNMIDSKNKANKKEKQNKNNINTNISNSNNSNQNQSLKKNKKEKKEEETNEDTNNNTENKYNNSLVNQISNDINEYSNITPLENIYEKNDVKYNSNNNYVDISDFGLDNFSKKLEDFYLLYSNDYIQKIKKDDFSLEIELYIEKLIELISEYHLQIEEKEIEYQLLQNAYKKNIHLLKEQNKLYKKLQLIIDDNNIKETNKKMIINHHSKNKINNLLTNKNEINIFNFAIYSQKEKENTEKKEKLKKILKSILSKPKHKNIINQNEKISKWIKINMDKFEAIKDKGKKRINTAKTTKTQQEVDKGKYNKKKKNNNNNNSPKNKTKFNKK